MSVVDGVWIDQNGDEIAGSYVSHANLEDYTPSGKIGYRSDDSGAVTTYTYDGYSERLTGIDTVLSGNAIQSKSYVYAMAGNIDSITDNLTNVKNKYEYDSLHRLKNERYPGSGQPETFETAGIVPISGNLIS